MEFYKIKLQMVKEETIKYKKEDIKSTSEVVNFINNIEQYNLAPEENVILICLNNKNKIIAYTEISKRRK